MDEILAYKYAEDRNPCRKQSDNLLSVFRFNQEVKLDFLDTHGRMQLIWTIKWRSLQKFQLMQSDYIFV